MHIVILVLTAVGGAVWWWIRNNPRDAIDTAQDAATILRNAPRRLAFRRMTKEHPVEGIDDPRIAIGSIVQAFLELDDLPTREQREQVHYLFRKKLGCSDEEAQEIETLGRWLIEQCNGPNQAISRLGRRLFKIEGASSWGLLQEMLSDLVSEELSARQLDAIKDLKLALKK